MTLVKLAPDSVQSWIDLSISLYRTGQTQQAYDTLAAKLEKFPMEWSVNYNLACYAAQLGNIGEAKGFLERAFALGGDNQVKLIALDDPDLEPLWNQIGKRE